MNFKRIFQPKPGEDRPLTEAQALQNASGKQEAPQAEAKPISLEEYNLLANSYNSVLWQA